MDDHKQLWLLKRENIPQFKTKTKNFLSKKIGNVIKYIDNLNKKYLDCLKYRTKYYNLTKKKSNKPKKKKQKISKNEMDVDESKNEKKMEIDVSKNISKENTMEIDVSKNISKENTIEIDKSKLKKQKKMKQRKITRHINKALPQIEQKLDELTTEEQAKALTTILKKNKYSKMNVEMETHYLQQIKAKHEEEVKEMRKDEKNGLRNYLVMSLSGSQKNYRSNYVFDNFIRDKQGKLLPKMTSLGLILGTKTNEQFNLKMFKQFLKKIKHEETDMVPVVFLFKKNKQLLEAIEYELSKEGRQITKLIKQDFYCYGSIRRNTLKYIISFCILKYSYEIKKLKNDKEKLDITIQFCIDGYGVKGNHRGSNCIDCKIRFPNHHRGSGNVQELQTIAQFWCKENFDGYYNVFHTYFSKIINLLENSDFPYLKFKS